MIVKIFLVVLLTLASTSSYADITHFLTAQWMENGNRFCRYDNGTVLNVGINLCPLTI